jgi:putative PIN family toxin of toxin-antitoxin system
VSALIKPTGPPGRIVQALRADGLVPVVCPQLLGELVQVLLRPKFRTYVSPAEVSAYLEIIIARAQHWPDLVDAPALCRDPHDDYLLALAASADADCIISGDADLLSVASSSVAVLSPRAFVNSASL